MGWGVQKREHLLPGAACLGPRPVPLLSVTEEMSGVVTQCTDEPWNSSAHSSLLFVVVVLGAALDMAVFRTVVIVIVCLTSDFLPPSGRVLGMGLPTEPVFAGSLFSYLVFHVPAPYITSLIPLGSWGEG